MPHSPQTAPPPPAAADIAAPALQALLWAVADSSDDADRTAAAKGAWDAAGRPGLLPRVDPLEMLRRMAADPDPSGVLAAQVLAEAGDTLGGALRSLVPRLESALAGHAADASAALSFLVCLVATCENPTVADAPPPPPTTTATPPPPMASGAPGKPRRGRPPKSATHARLNLVPTPTQRTP